MCGHATIALGRFLVDTQDADTFPRLSHISSHSEGHQTTVRLHAPCGIVRVTVPTIGEGNSHKSDPLRRVSFISVPSFVNASNVTVSIPEDSVWPALKRLGRAEVTVDVAFGGAFYAVVSAAELGFTDGIRAYALQDINEATRALKEVLKQMEELYSHPDEEALEFLYGVIVTEQLGERRELGLCFFANQQVDRSPTGSGVCARISLAFHKGQLAIGEDMVFESVVSIIGDDMGFVGRAVERLLYTDKKGARRTAVRVCVEGRAFYTGAHSFVVEESDGLRNGLELNTMLTLSG